MISARFWLLDAGGGAGEPLSFFRDKEEIPVRAPEEYLSPMYEYTGPARFAFFRKVSKPAALADEPPSPWPPGRAPVAFVDLPAAGGDFLLLLAKNREGGLRVIPMPFGEDAVPRDGYVFWNISSRAIGVKLGSARALAEPGQRVVLRQSTGAGYMPLKLVDAHEGRERQVFASRHLHRDGARQIVFIRDGERLDRVRIRMVTQPSLSISASPSQSAAAP